MALRIRWHAWLVVVLCSHPVRAEDNPRAEVGGYFRVSTRPDADGGEGKLGLWNFYGRLMNETSFLGLELKVRMISDRAVMGRPWASAHVRIEGGATPTLSGPQGSLGSFRVAQLYVEAGEVLFSRVVWRVGTLGYSVGDLGLYDFRPAELFRETLGLSATLKFERFEVLFGMGDAGLAIRGSDYHSVLTGGFFARFQPLDSFEIGVGFQGFFEPTGPGNRLAPHATPDVAYEDYARREVVDRYLSNHPGQEDRFYQNLPPRPVSAESYVGVGYIGFGRLGPLDWNSFFVRIERLHPQSVTTEVVGSREYSIYLHDLTDDRWQVLVGNEATLTVVPNWLDLAWGSAFLWAKNSDNSRVAGEDNRRAVSTVLRLQGYLAETLHILLETSLAAERSLHGNFYRLRHDSIFTSTRGRADSRGLELGDSDTRNTWQLKVGPVLNPSGLGIFARPSLRALVGFQWSNIHRAFSSNRSETLDTFTQLGHLGESRMTHLLFGLEAEAWF